MQRNKLEQKDTNMAATITKQKDAIQDIVRNVLSTGFFDKIKITSGKKDTQIEALEKDKQVILKARMLQPVEGWQGEFGLANLSLLSAMASDSEFTHKDSTLELVTQMRGGEDVPVELHYKNRSKSFISYRFVAKEMVPDQPKYNEPPWDVTIKPTKSVIQQFAWAAGSLSSYEQYFIPKTVDGELRMFIGEDGAASQRGGVVFAADVQGEFESNHKWPIPLVSQVLKLVSESDADFRLSVKGALQITLNTGIAEYRYIFPAKMR
jgi:hypothetical protein